MSGLAFAGAGVAVGIGLVLLLRIIGQYVSAPINRLHRRWLERRLRLRLTRGSDRYFEELRSIETSLAVSDRAPPIRPVDRAVQIASVPFVGILLLSWFLPEDQVPDWTRLMGPCIFMLLGVQLAWGANDLSGRPTLGTRILGFTLIVLSSAIFILGLTRHS